MSQNESPDRLVLVDDDPIARLLTRAALEERGFVVEEAEDGAGALGMVESIRPDVVVLDALMPAMDGFETCALPRQSPHFEHLPILRLELESALHKAIERSELLLYYQPQVDSRTLKVVGAEALMRWKRGDKLISPADFIPLAHDSGLLIPMGEWAIRTAALEAKRWIDEGFEPVARIARGTHNEASMRALLGTLCENMVALAPDGSWVDGQVSRVAELLEDELDSARLAEAEETLRSAIVSQGALKQSLEEAKHALKSMLATFVDRLAAVSDQAGQFHDRMDGYVNQIEQADDIHALSDLVNDLMGDTRHMQSSMRATHDELVTARDRAREMEGRVTQLETELKHVSEQVRMDPLTDVLNRRGLAKAFEVECSRATRTQSSLAVAVIDIDDFKRLNDSLGHAAGDEALKHLSNVVRRAIRPTDVVARFGGEEFVLLLPGNSLEESRAAVQRLQRQLTREFFLHDGQRVFIAFSAGVAVYRDGESEWATLERADGALYVAKRAGKNRVMCEGETVANVAE